MMVDRRDFFRCLLSEGSALFDEIKGNQQLRLGEIHLLPDDAVRKVVPCLDLTGNFVIHRRFVMERQKTGGVMKAIFEFDDQEYHILNLMDGRRTIEAISKIVEADRGVEDKTAYHRVRSLFIRLVKGGLCRPSNSRDASCL
jgi:hypothetical protein